MNKQVIKELESILSDSISVYITSHSTIKKPIDSNISKIKNVDSIYAPKSAYKDDESNSSLIITVSNEKPIVDDESFSVKFTDETKAVDIFFTDNINKVDTAMLEHFISVIATMLFVKGHEIYWDGKTFKP